SGLLVAHRDRRVAGRRLAPRAAGIAEHALFQAREVGQVLVNKSVAGAAEAGEPVLDVGGVAWLRHLAVVNEIDAGFDLLRHHLGHRRAHARGERDRIDRHAFFLGEHHADEVGGPWQAAGVGGEEALGAAFHPTMVSNWRRLVPRFRSSQQIAIRTSAVIGPRAPAHPLDPTYRLCCRRAARAYPCCHSLAARQSLQSAHRLMLESTLRSALEPWQLPRRAGDQRAVLWARPWPRPPAPGATPA